MASVEVAKRKKRWKQKRENKGKVGIRTEFRRTERIGMICQGLQN